MLKVLCLSHLIFLLMSSTNAWSKGKGPLHQDPIFRKDAVLGETRTYVTTAIGFFGTQTCQDTGRGHVMAQARAKCREYQYRIDECKVLSLSKGAASAYQGTYNPNGIYKSQCSFEAVYSITKKKKKKYSIYFGSHKFSRSGYAITNVVSKFSQNNPSAPRLEFKTVVDVGQIASRYEFHIYLNAKSHTEESYDYGEICIAESELDLFPTNWPLVNENFYFTINESSNSGMWDDCDSDELLVTATLTILN